MLLATPVLDKPGAVGSLYQRIYAVVDQIPAGKVATYGQIAKIVGQCSPRSVGYAMAAIPFGMEVPWQRVINSQGRISDRRRGLGASRQREWLQDEGVVFDEMGIIDLSRWRWRGPDKKWLIANGFDTA